MNLDTLRLPRLNTLMFSKKKTNTIFPILAGIVFCLLLGCGGGSTTSSRTPDPVITPEPIDSGCRPSVGDECQSVELPQAPDEPDNHGMEPDEPDNTMPPPGPVIPLPTGLSNEVKFSLVKAQQVWGEGENGYTGKGVVVGVMEEVNPFHVLFGSGDDSKIHPDSVLTSPYPDNLPPPPSKYIAENENDLVMNDKSPTSSSPRMKKYPPVPCLLQFKDVTDCPDISGDTKYFLRDGDGSLQVLPGLVDPNPEDHQCPVFGIGEDSREVCSQFGAEHGTGVAGVAAAHSGILTFSGNGERSHARFQGVAHGADILVYARPLHIAGFPSSIENHADYFRDAPADADVYTFSHTFSTVIDRRDITRKHLPSQNTNNYSEFTPIADAIRDKDIPVIAATGNHDESIPLFPAALPLFFPDLRGHILAVTAVRDTGQHTVYANRCGLLPRDWNPEEHGRHYCIAAPGGYTGHLTEPFWLTGPDNEGVYRGQGTSFAVPVVAGAFAILKERFRNKDGTDSMSNKELIFRLMDTADRTGLHDGSVVYGAGLLDIEAAIEPFETMSMSVLGNVKEGITYEFDTTSLSTSAAFGDALQRAFQTREVVAFDKLDAPFWHPLSSIVTTTSSRETIQERHADLFEHDSPPVETAIGGRLALTSTNTGSPEQIDMSLRQPVDIPVAQAELLLTAGDLSTAPFGLHEDKSFAHPYLHFAEEGIGLGGALQIGTGQLTAMGFTSGSANISRDIPVIAYGGLLEYALEPITGIEFGMQAGAMLEESRALGLLSEGGFGELGESSTAFAGISLDGELEDGWRFRASMLFGRTNLDEPSIGLLKTSSTLTSSAFRVAIEGSDVLQDSDRMDVFVAQPLRIETGKADFTIPIGRTPSSLVKREQINGVSLEPGGRELEFGARYEMQVREDITAVGVIGIVHEGGHSKHTATELYGLANLRFQF